METLIVIENMTKSISDRMVVMVKKDPISFLSKAK